MAVILSVIMITGLCSCTADQAPPPGASYASSRQAGLENPLNSRPGGAADGERQSFLEIIEEKRAINSDTVGYLRVPGTTVDDVVLWYPDDPNEFYLRRNFNKDYQKEGCYYADFRCSFEGGAEGLSRNTVIYGHSLDLYDDPEAPYFSQLKKFLDEDFARATPYIRFSVGEEDLVWEVFAVYYATTDLYYNTPDPVNSEFAALLTEMTKRSEYIYDVDVTAADKILTLSTCTYVFNQEYPNKYRYVVAARLAGSDEPLKDAASLEKNPYPKDP
jgi:sortase B